MYIYIYMPVASSYMRGFRTTYGKTGYICCRVRESPVRMGTYLKIGWKLRENHVSCIARTFFEIREIRVLLPTMARFSRDGAETAQPDSIGMYVCMYVRVCVCVYVCMCACMYVCLHACMHACMYVCMYVCMCVCVQSCNVWYCSVL